VMTGAENKYMRVGILIQSHRAGAEALSVLLATISPRKLPSLPTFHLHRKPLLFCSYSLTTIAIVKMINCASEYSTF